MVRKAFLVVLLTACGLALSGCGPCGFDWRWPNSCRSEPAPPR